MCCSGDDAVSGNTPVRVVPSLKYAAVHMPRPSPTGSQNDMDNGSTMPHQAAGRQLCSTRF